MNFGSTLSVSESVWFVFSLCEFVDHSVCPEKQERSTKSQEPTRNSLPKSTIEAKRVR